MESRICRLSWFLDLGGWSKTATVGLYFIFPGICTLSPSRVLAKFCSPSLGIPMIHNSMAVNYYIQTELECVISKDLLPKSKCKITGLSHTGYDQETGEMAKWLSHYRQVKELEFRSPDSMYIPGSSGTLDSINSA
ncbi:hypothetical protein STEG23_032713 [Scotinomys teguina]